ncbi:hypothetical protein PsorP6_017490 [Peronosclerospora sorghi]|uniref:Uncharacterized protein n=1 Tax=Peronosclerospora sorghi TaxID=230839 RepID=A0ACC0WLT1_9STRA|nr:hypothetical protein PsorP6_017490 [Peronosclerospora sorghi]
MVKPYLWLALTAFVAWIHSAKVVKALAATNKTETLTRTNNVMTIEDDEEKMLKGTLEKISDMSLALSPRSNQLKRMKSKLLRQVPKDTIGLTLKDPHLEDLMHSYSSEASDRSGLIRLLTERYGDGTMAEALLDAKKTDAHPARESAEKLLDWQLDRYWFTTAYGNTDVALVLARARRADITKTIAATLQTEHFEKLTGDREAFDEVFAGFKLWDDLVDDRGQRVLVLEDYMEFFNERHSMNVTLEAVLRKLLGERNYEAAVKKAASKLRSLIALELSRSLPRQRDE